MSVVGERNPIVKLLHLLFGAASRIEQLEREHREEIAALEDDRAELKARVEWLEADRDRFREALRWVLDFAEEQMPEEEGLIEVCRAALSPGAKGEDPESVEGREKEPHNDNSLRNGMEHMGTLNRGGSTMAAERHFCEVCGLFEDEHPEPRPGPPMPPPPRRAGDESFYRMPHEFKPSRFTLPELLDERDAQIDFWRRRTYKLHHRLNRILNACGIGSEALSPSNAAELREGAPPTTPAPNPRSG